MLRALLHGNPRWGGASICGAVLKFISKNESGLLAMFALWGHVSRGWRFPGKLFLIAAGFKRCIQDAGEEEM